MTHFYKVELSREIIRLNGLSTEGIFRLPGEIDKVTLLKVKVEGKMTHLHVYMTHNDL